MTKRNTSHRLVFLFLFCWSYIAFPLRRLQGPERADTQFANVQMKDPGAPAALETIGWSLNNMADLLSLKNATIVLNEGTMAFRSALLVPPVLGAKDARLGGRILMWDRVRLHAGDPERLYGRGGDDFPHINKRFNMKFRRLL